MAILAFQRPDKVVMVESTDKHGVFEFRPLEPGYGMTIGNALRRVLLSSLEGYAITSIRIEGVEHEMAPIPGVIEDLTDIVLKFKQVRFKQQIPGETFEKVTVVIGGQEEFVAGDINKFLSVFQVLNPELLICHMDPSVRLTIDITINKGRGYVNADENKVLNAPLNTIAIDSIHTPIRNVSFKVENFRVEQKTDYEKLILDIETDGSINPKDAMTEAAKILIYHFMLFSDEKISMETTKEVVSNELDEESLRMRHLLLTKLSDMELSVRALNCLKAAEIETFADLVSHQRPDLMKFRNFGKKSLTEIDMLMDRLKLSFGMDVTKYNIEVKKK